MSCNKQECNVSDEVKELVGGIERAMNFAAKNPSSDKMTFDEFNDRTLVRNALGAALRAVHLFDPLWAQVYRDRLVDEGFKSQVESKADDV
jgi:hypothetical protein